MSSLAGRGWNLIASRKYTVLLIVIGLIIALVPLPAFTAPVDRVFRIEAGDFAFTPAVIRVNPGDRVTIELVATDVAHGLSIDGYPVDLHAEPGQTARTAFTAGRAGAFKMRCSIACGNLHPFMTGKFEVGPNLIFIRSLGLILLVGLAGILSATGKAQAAHG